MFSYNDLAVTFSDSDMLDLARALKQLSESACSSLTELSVSVLPHTELVDVLLDASPNITSLCVEVLTVHWAPRIPTQRPVAAVTGGFILLVPGKHGNIPVLKYKCNVEGDRLGVCGTL